jgi:hypothetical protein
VIIIIKIINNTTYYVIPNTEGRYCINANCDVYNTKTQSFATKEGNTVKLSTNGSRKRYNCDKLLIEALITHINEIKQFINSQL